MKILYAVQGTGNGHIARARAMAVAFKQLDIQVDWLFSGRDCNAYFDMQVFGDYRCLKGLSFIIENNQIKPFKSFWQSNLLQFYRDIKSINFGQYDVIVNDFEPITAWAAYLQKKPTIGLSNQMSLLKNNSAIKSSWLLRKSIRYFAPVTTPIGISWHRLAHNIIPPITIKNPNAISHNPKKIIVYLPFYSANQLNQIFAQFTDYTFDIFHAEKPDIKHTHIIFNGFSREAFSKKTAACAGIISNPGFGLSTEAMQMGKKLLLEPVEKHAEQNINASLLKQFESVTIAKKINTEIISKWRQYSHVQKVIWPDVALQLAKWLTQNEHATLDDFSKNLWQQVDII